MVTYVKLNFLINSFQPFLPGKMIVKLREVSLATVTKDGSNHTWTRV